MKDWELIESGDLKIAGGVDWIVSNEFELQQRLIVRLRFFYGEWYRDITKGIDYYGKVFIKNPDYAIIAQELRRQILLTTDVTEILEFDMRQLENVPRGLAVTFTVLSTYSDATTINVELP